MKKNIFNASLTMTLILGCLSAYAGQEGGGTYALCDYTLIHYARPMSQLKGQHGKGSAFEDYRAIIETMREKLPRLAKQLEKVENYEWFELSPSEGCRFVERVPADDHSPLQLPIDVEEAIHMNTETEQVFVMGHRFENLKDPEISLLNEAVRTICAQAYSDSELEHACVLGLGVTLATTGRTGSAGKISAEIKRKKSTSQLSYYGFVGFTKNQYLQYLEEFKLLPKAFEAFAQEYTRVTEFLTTQTRPMLPKAGCEYPSFWYPALMTKEDAAHMRLFSRQKYESCVYEFSTPLIELLRPIAQLNPLGKLAFLWENISPADGITQMPVPIQGFDNPQAIARTRRGFYNMANMTLEQAIEISTTK